MKVRRLSSSLVSMVQVLVLWWCLWWTLLSCSCSFRVGQSCWCASSFVLLDHVPATSSHAGRNRQRIVSSVAVRSSCSSCNSQKDSFQAEDGDEIEIQVVDLLSTSTSTTSTSTQHPVPVRSFRSDETSATANDQQRRKLFRKGALSVAASLTAAAAALFVTPNGNINTAALAYESDEARRIAIFERTSPSVVFIDTFTERRDSLSTNIMEVPLGSGSGFVWDKEGHIVTNFHVVRNAATAQVAILLSTPEAVTAAKAAEAAQAASHAGPPSLEQSLSNSGISIVKSSFSSSRALRSSKNQPGSFRKVFTARIVGLDPGKDIAVLKIEADPAFLYPIQPGTSTGLKVGQQAMAIGNPFGLDHTLTSGIISGTGREVKSPIGRPITNVIQSDAAINPGNSGGPLLDSSGKLIGMNTAIYSPSGASAGVGFAIPVDTVKLIVDTLIRDGQVVRPVLGISFLGSKQARTLGITSGVLVLEVPSDSPAAKAGLKGTRRTESGLIELGDIIIQVNNEVIDVEADLFEALEDCKPGDTVEVTVNRLAAVNDELRVKVIKLQIVLQSSAQLEKSLQQLYALPPPPGPTVPSIP